METINFHQNFTSNVKLRSPTIFYVFDNMYYIFPIGASNSRFGILYHDESSNHFHNRFASNSSIDLKSRKYLPHSQTYSKSWHTCPENSQRSPLACRKSSNQLLSSHNLENIKVARSMDANILGGAFSKQDHDHPSFLAGDVTTWSREFPRSGTRERAGEQAKHLADRDGTRKLGRR